MVEWVVFSLRGCKVNWYRWASGPGFDSRPALHINNHFWDSNLCFPCVSAWLKINTWFNSPQNTLKNLSRNRCCISPQIFLQGLFISILWKLGLIILLIWLIYTPKNTYTVKRKYCSCMFVTSGNQHYKTNLTGNQHYKTKSGSGCTVLSLVAVFLHTNCTQPVEI